MSMLEKYIERQAVALAAFAKMDEDLYHYIVEMEVFLLLYDEEQQVFGFWPVNDRHHAFKVEAIEEAGDFVTLFHRDGKLELSPPLPNQARNIIAWQKQIDMEAATIALKQAMDAVARDPKSRLKGRKKRYQVAIEYRLVNGTWQIAGGWAVNKKEITFWGEPGFENVTKTRKNQISVATAKPLELYEYVIESANIMTDVIPSGEVEAELVGTAALLAVLRAKQAAG